MPYWEDEEVEEVEDFEDGETGIRFANPGSALRAGNRCHPCPTCGTPNRLTAEDVSLGYQCDPCADALERGGY